MVEWDPEKANSNLRKHRVDFADAAAVLEDPEALTRPDDHSDEDRWISLGMDSLGRVLVVVYTWREEEVRLISARKATAAEHRQYEDD